MFKLNSAPLHIGDKYSHGIYDTHIKIRGAPFLEEHELTGPAHDKLRVSEVMADRLVTLRPVMKAREGRGGGGGGGGGA